MDLTNLQIAVIEAQKGLALAQFNLVSGQQDNKIEEMRAKQNAGTTTPSG